MKTVGAHDMIFFGVEANKEENCLVHFLSQMEAVPF